MTQRMDGLVIEVSIVSQLVVKEGCIYQGFHITRCNRAHATTSEDDDAAPLRHDQSTITKRASSPTQYDCRIKSLAILIARRCQDKLDATKIATWNDKPYTGGQSCDLIQRVDYTSGQKVCIRLSKVRRDIQIVHIFMLGKRKSFL